MKTNAAEISIGSKKYDVAIESIRPWSSADGAVAREYLTIGKPGISEVTGAYIIRAGSTMRAVDKSVVTDAGTVVWTPADGTSGAKTSAINLWFQTVLAQNNILS